LAGQRTREAFDLARESVRTRERYGDTHWGKSLLTCRRLVEAGVRFVQCQAEFRHDPAVANITTFDDHSVNANIFQAYEAKMPHFDWPAYFSATGMGSPSAVIVGQPDYLAAADSLLANTPIATWREYLASKLLDAYANELSSPFVQARFDFRGKVLNGQQEQRARWKRGVTEVELGLGDAAGKLYVARHFKPEAKARMDALIRNLREAYSLGIDSLEWMTPATKARAKDKLLEQRDQGIVRQYVGQGYIDDLVSKNNWASMAWSGDVFYYKELGGAPDLEFVVPSEGGVIWTGPLQIPVQAEHPADAHAFMDFYYRPEIAAMVTDWVLYMTPVDGVHDIMLEKAKNLTGADRQYYETLANSPLLFPPDDPASANLYEYKAFDGKEFEEYSALFQQVVNG